MVLTENTTQQSLPLEIRSEMLERKHFVLKQPKQFEHMDVLCVCVLSTTMCTGRGP